jgi:hypothetical protein
MRGLIGLLVLALILVFMHDSAEGEARLHCEPVLVPPPPVCVPTMGHSITAMPKECRRA